MAEKRLQITINNDELYNTIMSISRPQRGQFVTMALAAYIKTSEGKYLVDQFAKHKPDASKINEESFSNNTATIESKESKKSVMGDFE